MFELFEGFGTGYGWLVRLGPSAYPQLQALRRRVGLRPAAAVSAAVPARPRWSVRWIDIRATPEHHPSDCGKGRQAATAVSLAPGRAVAVPAKR
jgi:hypothetical protein